MSDDKCDEMCSVRKFHPHDACFGYFVRSESFFMNDSLHAAGHPAGKPEWSGAENHGVHQ